MKNKPYNLVNKFVYRASLFPISHINHEDIYQDKIFAEAIFLASVDLHSQLNFNKNKEFNSLPEKLKRTVLKYIIRISSRCTPFGLFAGCGVGSFGETNSIILAQEHFSSMTRLDMSVLFEISKKISDSKDFQSKIIWRINTSLLKLGKMSFRFHEHKHINHSRKYFISEIDFEEHLLKLINAAKEGATITQLVAILMNEGYDGDQSEIYIRDLIQNQILIPECESFATSDLSPMEVLIKRLDQLGNKKVEERLVKIKENLKQIDAKAIGRNVDLYQNIEEQIRELNIKYSPQHLFQSDVAINSPLATLDHEIFHTVKQGLVLLNKITPKNKIPEIEKFKKDFYLRYENQEIPILEALDVDMGVGFGNIDQKEFSINPLLADLNLNVSEVKNQNSIEFADLLVDVYNLDKTGNVKEIEVRDEYLEKLKDKWDDLPLTLSSIVEIISVKNKPLIFMNSVNGSSGANLLSRFCLSNPELHKHVKTLIEFESEKIGKDTILAEIAHIPQNRLGNVIHRPCLRNYEIPYLTSSLKSPKHIINLEDILVSVVDGEIKLRSNSLDKYVIPMLTSAHNYKYDSLPIYHFLSTLYIQNKRNSLGFSWGNNLLKSNSLPRVRYKNIIISTAKWRLSKKDFSLTSDIKDINNMFRDELQKFGIYNKVFIVDGDNKLLIDINNEHSLSLLFQELQKKTLLLEECLYENDFLIQSHRGGHTNQIIFNFTKNEE